MHGNILHSYDEIELLGVSNSYWHKIIYPYFVVLKSIRANMKHLLLVTLVFISSIGFTQSPEEEFNQLKSLFPNHGSAFTIRKEKITINIIGDSLQVFNETEEEIMILKDEFASQNERSVQYSSFSKIKNLKAESRIPSKKKYKSQPVSKFKEKDVFGGSVFHNDVKEISFKYPSLKSGVKKYIKYKEILKEPRFIGGFFLHSYLPSLSCEYIVNMDQNIDFGISEFNTDGIEYSKTETISNGRKILKITAKNTPPINAESGAPNVRYYAPHFQCRIKSYTVNNKTIPLLESPKDLHKWYSSLIKDINQDDHTELKRIADSITIDITDELTKVKTVFQWVQSNIKYVAFEDGLGGFVPRNAAQVCDRRFGDCKDMANITRTMLQLIGIEAYLVWIGSDDIPYRYTEVPTPSVDNHMIAAYKHNEEYIFLDATSSFTPFGMPSSFIQGKDAMIHLSNDAFEIIPVPIIPSSKNQVNDITYLSIQEDKLIGKGKLTLTGYYKEVQTERLRRLEPNEKKDYYKNYLEKGSNKFVIKDFMEENIMKRDLPTIIRYNYEVADYATFNGDEIYINLNLDKTYAKSDIEKDRKLPYKYRFQNSLLYTNYLEIPKGYTIDYLPKPAQATYPGFSYAIDYKVENGRIKYTFELHKDFLLLYPNQFDDWNQFVKHLKTAYNDAIILKKEE